MNEHLLKVIEYLGGTPNYRPGWTGIRCVSPNHEDTRQSARINYDEQAYACLGCGLKAGSAFQLLERSLQLDFDRANREYAVATGETYRGVRESTSGQPRGFNLSNGAARFESGSGFGAKTWLRR